MAGPDGMQRPAITERLGTEVTREAFDYDQPWRKHTSSCVWREAIDTAGKRKFSAEVMTAPGNHDE
jgi:hypothetical protein